MSTYEINRSEIKNLQPVAEGYKVIQWDGSSKYVDFRYGEMGENLVGKVYRVDGNLSICHHGLHFSKCPEDVFKSYNPLGYNRYFKVRAYGQCVDEDHESVAEILEFVEEYTITQYIWQNNGEESVMNDDVRAAMLGDHEAAKRLTEKGVLLPCPFCGGIVDITAFDPRLLRPSCNHVYCVVCWDCDMLFGWDIDYGGRFDTEEEARLAWNTRAKIGEADEHSL